MEHLLAEAKLVEKDGPEEDALAKISRYAKELIKKQGELAVLQNEVKDKQAECTKLSQESIPQSMLEVNMTSFQLDTGAVVAFEDDISCTVQDAEALYDFLEERGDGNLMKITLEIGKVPKNILALIIKELYEKFDILPTTEATIHWATIKSYIKKLCGIGGKNEAELTLAELDEKMITTFTYYRTTVK